MCLKNLITNKTNITNILIIDIILQVTKKNAIKEESS